MGKKNVLFYQILCVLLLLGLIYLLYSNKQNKGEAETLTSVSGEAKQEPETFFLSTEVRDSFLLPDPAEKGGMPLNEALKKRETNRVFVEKNLTDAQISNLLWAANGVNRKEENKRTAPSARNCQEIDMYLFTKQAIYKYMPFSHSLKLVKTGDFRGKAGNNVFFQTAPVALVFVADFAKMKDYDEAGKSFYSATDVGFVSQNLYLHCASEGYSTCVCGYIQRDELAELLSITDGKVLLSQPVGYSN